MKTSSIELIQELINMIQSQKESIDILRAFSEEDLNSKNDPKSWSVLECIEHLNLVLNFYIPEITARIESSHIPKSIFFKGTFLGNKFAQSMLPKENMKRMKTFKKVNPNASSLVKDEVLEMFMNHENNLLILLEKAKSKNLTKIKTSTLVPLLKLRLGNTFQLMAYHNERHIVQAKKILQHQAS